MKLQYAFTKLWYIRMTQFKPNIILHIWVIYSRIAQEFYQGTHNKMHVYACEKI